MRPLRQAMNLVDADESQARDVANFSAYDRLRGHVEDVDFAGLKVDKKLCVVFFTQL